MTFQLITTVISGAGTGVSLGLVDSVYVAASGFVASTAVIGINGDGAAHHATIWGGVYGATAMYLGSNGATDTGQMVFIGSTGTLSASGYGARLVGHSSTLENHGTIQSDLVGVEFYSGLAGTSTLMNFGLITATNTAIGHDLLSVNTLILRNFGTISSAGYAFDATMASGGDHVINRGLIIGDIRLGAGADTYDGRGGTMEGLVEGGDGDDLLRPGLGIERIDGGAGRDTLDFAQGGAIKVALDGSFDGTKAATDDTYSSIENIIGSRNGNDTLTGDLADNALTGNGGDDVLAGGAGLDTLTGNTGADRLSGGTGSDLFVFYALGDAGDTVTDFRNVAGNNDAFSLYVSGFGGGLVAGVLAGSRFQTRADNLAQDGDDRFIFNTATHTLWFDVDGTGASGPVQLVALLGPTVLTAADILLV